MTAIKTDWIKLSFMTFPRQMLIVAFLAKEFTPISSKGAGSKGARGGGVGDRWSKIQRRRK